MVRRVGPVDVRTVPFFLSPRLRRLNKKSGFPEALFRTASVGGQDTMPFLRLPSPCRTYEIRIAGRDH